MKSRIHAPESLEKRDLLTVQMVLDINSEDTGINPSFVTSFKDEIYFAANVGETLEAEIWKSDGTVEGTQFVTSFGNGEIIQLGATEDRLIGVVEIDADNRHPTTLLFSTDGTQEGTVELVRGLDKPHENPYNDDLSALVISNDIAFVRAGSGSGHDGDINVIYATDGTLEGTSEGFPPPDEVGVASVLTYHRDWFAPDYWLRPLAPASNPRDLTLAGDRLFFTASGADTREVWESDGTQSSAIAMPGESTSNPRRLFSHEGNLFFVVDDGTGLGAWVVTEGSSSARRLGDADTTTTFVKADSGLLFTKRSDADGALAARDVDELEVRLIDENFEVTLLGSIPREHSNLTWFADSIVYSRSTDDGHVLERVAESEKVASVAIGTFPDQFLVEGDQLFFTSTTENGRELWTFDGNAAVEIDMPFRSGSITTDFHALEYFSVVTTAGDAEGSGKALIGFVPGAGRELTAIENPETWPLRVSTIVSDGTAQGTSLIQSVSMSGWYYASVEIDEEIFLPSGWSDGVWWSTHADEARWDTASTNEREMLREVVDWCCDDFFNPRNAPRNSAERVSFSAEELSQLGITSMFLNSNPHTGTTPGRGFAVNDLIYFVAGTEEFGRELWQSDGTAEGTKMVRDIFPGPRSSDARLLGASGDTLFFMANDGVHGQELWSVTVDEAFSDEPLVGDLDNDGEVNFADFLAFSQDFGRTSEPDETLPSDFDRNGTVDFADFLLLSENFGPSIS